MAADETSKPRRGSRAKLWFVLVLLAVVGVFCWKNRMQVPVWPMKEPVPLYAVALGGLVVGFLFGFVLRGIARRRRDVKVRIT